MEIQFSDENDRLIVRPAGRLEAADGDVFAKAVEERLGATTKQVLVDLAQLKFINFGGIRAILRLARSLKARDTGLAFTGAGGAVWEALDISGIDDLFPFDRPIRGIQDAARTP